MELFFIELIILLISNFFLHFVEILKNKHECEVSRTAGLTLREPDGQTNLLNYNIL